jgi:hypothetical protein
LFSSISSARDLFLAGGVGATVESKGDFPGPGIFAEEEKNFLMPVCCISLVRPKRSEQKAV